MAKIEAVMDNRGKIAMFYCSSCRTKVFYSKQKFCSNCGMSLEPAQYLKQAQTTKLKKTK